MTVFNLYCDESRHTSDPSQRYAIIGALQCPREEKPRIVHRLHSLMAKHGTHGEFGWKKLSPNRHDFYFTLLDLFAEEQTLSFRCLVIDRQLLNHEGFNNGDAELGFYKLYYQMLVHWLQPGNTYHIYLDWQQNAASNRFSDLRNTLQTKLLGRANVACLEPVFSHNQPMIQLADLLMGAVGYQWNQLDERPGGSSEKRLFAQTLCTKLGVRSLVGQVGASEQKFNIVNWQGS